MFRQVVGTILRLAVEHADDWLPIRGSHAVPGLRLRADHRPATARGEHAPPPVGVPRRLADPRRHVALDAVARVARGRAGARGGGRPAGRRRAGEARASAATSRRRRRRRSRWPRRPARSTSPTTCGRGSSTTSSLTARNPTHPLETPRRGARADLLRAGRVVRDREPAHHDRTGGGSRRAPGARVRAAQAVPRPALERAPQRSARMSGHARRSRRGS